MNIELLHCVQTNLGMQDFWGSYLNEVPYASEELTMEEMQKAN
ncbi:MAG: hypothetical protein Q8934_05795 [Bacillota bacterium]|nr:hypothetical protein [Bacillota bacterium]